MGAERRVARCAGLLLVLAAACTRHPVALLTRPDGDGGWDDAARRAELGTRAAAGGVPYAPDAATGATAPSPAAPLTLADALTLARDGNRRIAVAARELEAASAQVRVARAQLLPDVTASGRYTRYSDPQTVGFALPATLGRAFAQAGIRVGPLPSSFVIREEEIGQVNGTVLVPLDVSGELTKTLQAAQAGYRGERARVWATTLDAQLATIRAYYELLSAERLREVTRQRLVSEREQLRTAQSKFDGGRLTKNELLVVQVSVRNVEQELVRRDLAIDEARWSLNGAVGRPVDAPTTVVDVHEWPALPDVDDALRDAFAHNPVLASLLEERQRLDAQLSALARGWLPRVQAGGTGDWNSQTITEPQTIGAGYVGVSWDLSTNGQRAAQIAAARSEVERTKLVLEAQLRELETAVRATQRRVAERLTALTTAEVAVAQAEENLRIRQQQFEAGRATSEDVLDAEALRAVQRATAATALYEAHMRRAELQQLIGLSLDAVAGGR